MPRSAGFTLIEVMVSVMLLASVAAASLKLVIMAQRTLAETGERQTLMNEAEAIEAGIVIGELKDRGTSGDISWVSEIREKEMFGEDFGKLRFAASADILPASSAVKWREITVTDKNSRTIILCSPAGKGNNAESRSLLREQHQAEDKSSEIK